VTRAACCAILLLNMAACATRPPSTVPAPPVPPQSTSQNPAPSSAELASAIDRDAKRSDQESDSIIRGELAAEASRDAEQCLSREPQSAACLYGRAVAYGLMARAHPTRAGEFLNGMLETLARAESADPDYDEAGPARVRALVLVRAPGWPLGPGDADAGLIAAQRAVALRPQYPPNLLALGEALAKTGNTNGARDAYLRARDAALASTAADQNEWLREADQGLQRK
jgi:hypothetical protein